MVAGPSGVLLVRGVFAAPPVAVDREGWKAEMASIGEYLDSYGERMPEALRAEQRRIAESLSA